MLGIVVFIIACIAVAFGLLLIFSKPRVVESKHGKSTSCISFGSLKATKPLVVVFSLLIASLIIVMSFGINNAFAKAGNSTSSICNMDNIEVSVSNSGIESIEDAVVANTSDEATIFIKQMSLIASDKRAQASKWTIKQDSKILYSGALGQTIDIVPPISIANNQQLKLSVEITMETNDAISLIGKSPVQLSFKLGNSFQEEAYGEITTTSDKFITSLSGFAKLSEKQIKDLSGKLSKLVKNANEQIAQLDDKEEIEKVIVDFDKNVLSLLKDGAKLNNASYEYGLTDLVNGCHNIKKAQKDTFKNDIDSISSTVDSNIDSAQDVTSVNKANADGAEKYTQVQNNVVSAEESGVWTVTFDSKEGSSVASQSVKYGNKITEPTEPTKEGFGFGGWYFSEDFSDEHKWKFNDEAYTVGIKAGDADNCSLILFANWTTATYTITFNATGCKNQPEAIENIPSGTTYSVSGDTFTLASSPEITREVEPDDSHTGDALWSPDSGTVTSNITVSVSFQEKTFKMTFNSKGCAGTPAEITGIPYGSGFYTRGDTIYVKKPDWTTFSTRKVVPDATHNATDVTWSPADCDGFINDDIEVDVFCGLKTYMMTFESTSCEIVPDPILGVPHGSTYEIVDNKFVVTGPEGTTFTAEREALPDEKHDGDPTWTPASGEITSNTKVGISFEIKKLTVSFKTDGCKDEPSSIENVPYGSIYTTNANILTINDPTEWTVIGSATCEPDKNHKGNAIWNKTSGITSGVIKDETEIEVSFEELPYSERSGYMVCIWDFSHDPKMTNTAYFGPATGADNRCLSVNKSSEHTQNNGHCIAIESWDEIVQHIEEGGLNDYTECKTCGCTHNVELEVPEGVSSSSFDFNKITGQCSGLYSSVANNFRKWNYWTDYGQPGPNVYKTSRLRATLNGYNNSVETFQVSKYAYEKNKTNDCLKADNCLLSCFPEVLQDKIKPRKYATPSNWSTSSQYTINSFDTIMDKLWLPDATEIWMTSQREYAENYDSLPVDTRETQFNKKASEGTGQYAYIKNFVYKEDGSIIDWVLSAPERKGTTYVVFSQAVKGENPVVPGKWYSASADTDYWALCPCFCLGPDASE